MPTNEEMIANLLAAVSHGDTQSLQAMLAEHVTFHFPGRNRFAGDYFGKSTVMEFWAAHHTTLTPLTLEAVHTTNDQAIAIVTLHAHLADKDLVCAGTGVFHIVGEQVVEWWYQLEDQSKFDGFWAYSAATA